ncbi:YqcI/YcgG family protein [Micromonospora sp. NPDC049101]|uniref:YqcI/YcgG family protein n=1 Tax=unclassified Micromonospora TaxID=2617518 RepID=UPI0033E574D4
MTVSTVNSESGRWPTGDGIPALQAIRPLTAQTRCPFASGANLVAAPGYRGGPIDDHLDRALADLTSFTGRAERDRLDAFVLRFPLTLVDAADLRGLGRLTHSLVRALLRGDPSQPRAVDPDLVQQPRWRLSYAGMDYFMAVFAPLYGSHHSRYTFGIADQVFVLLQPDSSFHLRLGRDPSRVRKSIRKRFARAGQSYDTHLLEAHKFVLPLAHGDPPVRWYDMPVL